jgi:hypothetical protein
VTRRAHAVAAYALGCFVAIVAWVLWAEFARAGAGKGGWAWGVALAVPMALWPTIAFALTLALAARRGLAVSRPVAIGFAAIAGAMTPGTMLLVRLAADAMGTRIRMSGGLFVGLSVMFMLGIAFAAWLAVLRGPDRPSP